MLSTGEESVWVLYDFSLHINPMAFFEGISNHVHQKGPADTVYFNFQCHCVPLYLED